MADLLDVKRARELRRALQALTRDVRTALIALDIEMKRPGAPADRGRRIAAIVNALEMANDRARFFALGEDYRRPRAVEPPQEGTDA